MSRLLIFGDSIMRGVIYDGRYRLCQSRLFPRLLAAGWQVEMRARMGSTVSQMLTALEKHLPDPAPDCTVLLGCGGNDCNFDWQAVSDSPQGDFLPQTPPESFTRLYGQCLDLVRSRGARVYVATLVPLEADLYFDWISRPLGSAPDKQPQNILSWLGHRSRLYRFQEYYDGLVRDAAAAAGAPLLELRRPFLLGPWPGLIGPDGVHPTESGHELIQTLIEDALLS